MSGVLARIIADGNRRRSKSFSKLPAIKGRKILVRIDAFGN